VTPRRRLTDSDVEALMSGHTPPDRPDLAATASFLRELPAQLSESEPIELAAPPRRRTRLLVAVAACAAAIVGLSGVVALRGGDDVVRPAVGGAALSDDTTTTTNAGAPATTVATPSGVVTAPVPNVANVPSESTSTSVANPQTPFARYAAAVVAWNQCVTVKGEAACGAKPDPVAFGIETPPSTNALTPSTSLQPAGQAGTGSSACTGKTDRPGLEHPDVLTC
jgi:hypothetical protein